MSQEITVGVNGVIPFFLKNKGGQLVDADSTPTVTGIQKNGVAITAGAAVVTQQEDATPAAITGRYEIALNTTGFVVNDYIELHLSAIIGGVTVPFSACVAMVERAAGQPSVVVC